MTFLESPSRSTLLLAHDLYCWRMIFSENRVSTPDQVRGRLFRDHALGRRGKRPSGGEQILDHLLADVAGDEDEPAGVVAVRPVGELDRWVRQVLHELHHHRAAAAGDVEQ